MLIICWSRFYDATYNSNHSIWKIALCKIKHFIHDLCTYLYLAYWWSVLRGQFFSNFSAIFLRYQANTCSISTVWLSYNNPLIASYIHWRHSDVVVSHFQLCILPMSLSLWTAFPCIPSFLSPLSFYVVVIVVILGIQEGTQVYF